MNVIIAIDSLKGCLSSVLANQSAADGVLSVSPDADIVQIPVSDGGEGWLSAYHAAIGGELITLPVRDPMMRWIEAQYLVKDQTAVIEIAQASGLTLLTPEERNPMVATSYGTGQLIVDAVRLGCREIIVGLGGSATSDCGKGMLRAVINAFGQNITWDELTALQDVHFTIATDVTNPLCGPQGAAHVFAPQKGATPEMVEALDGIARRFADLSARHFGYDCQNEAGAGAAGGLGYAFLQYMHADCRSGIELLLEAVGFDALLREASLVITGEGSADRQTLMGKLPFGILQSASRHQVPVALIAGRIADRQQLLDAGFTHVECINPPGLPLEEAMQPAVARQNIKATVQRLL
jgi:glycerate kinase